MQPIRDTRRRAFNSPDHDRDSDALCHVRVCIGRKSGSPLSSLWRKKKKEKHDTLPERFTWMTLYGGLDRRPRPCALLYGSSNPLLSCGGAYPTRVATTRGASCLVCTVRYRRKYVRWRRGYSQISFILLNSPLTWTHRSSSKPIAVCPHSFPRKWIRQWTFLSLTEARRPRLISLHVHDRNTVMHEMMPVHPRYLSFLYVSCRKLTCFYNMFLQLTGKQVSGELDYNWKKQMIRSVFPFSHKFSLNWIVI